MIHHYEMHPTIFTWIVLTYVVSPSLISCSSISPVSGCWWNTWMVVAWSVPSADGCISIGIISPPGISSWPPGLMISYCISSGCGCWPFSNCTIVDLCEDEGTRGAGGSPGCRGFLWIRFKCSLRLDLWKRPENSCEIFNHVIIMQYEMYTVILDWFSLDSQTHRTGPSRILGSLF